LFDCSPNLRLTSHSDAFEDGRATDVLDRLLVSEQVPSPPRPMARHPWEGKLGELKWTLFTGPIVVSGVPPFKFRIDPGQSSKSLYSVS
jgi:hypothetical protein